MCVLIYSGLCLSCYCPYFLSDDDKKRERTKRREFLKDAEKLTPEERDIRTVFCMQLAKGIREEDLEDFFSPAGTVVDVRLISDRNSRRSKGIAYVEFKTPDSLPKVSGDYSEVVFPLQSLPSLCFTRQLLSTSTRI